jgi:DNA-directed RNA polymerase subunit RPC12/RpoP
MSKQKTLFSLDEWNGARTEHWFSRKPNDKLLWNSIACPKCGKELYDRSEEVLTSFPPKRNIVCKACDFKGIRIL